jgi:hypothetical protein
MPKMKRLFWSGFLFVVAALVAVYGADFTWRQVLVGGIAMMVFHYADEQFGVAFTNNRPFTRYQFAISVTNLGGALQAAGLYKDELPAMSSLYESMSGKGGMVFTWLESELFFINTTNQFESHLEFFIDVPAQGSRKSERGFELSDTLEMRMSTDAYELVLLTREDRYSWPDTTRGKGLVLFRLPYKFFWEMQGDPYEAGKHDKVKAILAGAGLTYWADSEVSSAWNYKNEYGTFRWWDV